MSTDPANFVPFMRNYQTEKWFQLTDIKGFSSSERLTLHAGQFSKIAQVQKGMNKVAVMDTFYNFSMLWEFWWKEEICTYIWKQWFPCHKTVIKADFLSGEPFKLISAHIRYYPGSQCWQSTRIVTFQSPDKTKCTCHFAKAKTWTKKIVNAADTWELAI